VEIGGTLGALIMHPSSVYVTRSVHRFSALRSVYRWFRTTAPIRRATLGLPSGEIKDIVTGSAKMGPNGARVLSLVKVIAHVTHLINLKPHVRHYKYVY
jgi:hypothetical protein